MLYLVCKVFYLGILLFLLLYVDIGWKFCEMYEFCDWIVKVYGCELLVYKNLEGVVMGINLFVYGSVKYIDIMKIEGLKQVLNKYGFDVVFGGVCCDEEKFCVKECIYFFCDCFYCWDLKNQCLELWYNYNGQINKGESICVFLFFNWIELDIWQYIYLENIEIVLLYLVVECLVLECDGMLMMIDDDCIDLQLGEVIEKWMVCFCIFGCWLLIGVVEFEVQMLLEIIEEMLVLIISECQGCVIDCDQVGLMELKKCQGYF